jgi:hypothetical protein
MTGSAFQMTAQDSAKTAQNWGVHKLDYVSQQCGLLTNQEKKDDDAHLRPIQHCTGPFPMSKHFVMPTFFFSFCENFDWLNNAKAAKDVL